MKPSNEQFIRLDYTVLAYKKLHIWERVILAFMIGLDRAGRTFYGNMEYFKEAGLEPADCYRIFNKLENFGFVYKASDGSYRLNDLKTVYEVLEGG